MLPERDRLNPPVPSPHGPPDLRIRIRDADMAEVAIVPDYPAARRRNRHSGKTPPEWATHDQAGFSTRDAK
jgi:hypothetical protein